MFSFRVSPNAIASNRPRTAKAIATIASSRRVSANAIAMQVADLLNSKCETSRKTRASQTNLPARESDRKAYRELAKSNGDEATSCRCNCDDTGQPQ